MLIKNWIKNLIGPSVVDVEGIKIKIPLLASNVIRSALFEGYYEDSELRIVMNKLSQDDIVMEVGTGLGLLSTYCAKRIGNDRVFTFEANPALKQPIKTNYALNQVNPKLEIGLVGEQAGFNTFYVNNDFWGSSTVNVAENTKPITIPVINFNKKVREIDPTFLLIDIEGGEYELFKYADFHNVKKLMIEVHKRILTPEQTEFVINAIAKAGFKLVEGDGSEELYFER